MTQELKSMISHVPLNRRDIVKAVFGGRGIGYFWETRLLPKWVPLLLGVGLGIALASLVVNEAWYFAIPLALAMPTMVLLVKYPFSAVLVWILVVPFVVRAPGSVNRYVFWILHWAMIPATLALVILSNALGIRKNRSVRFGLAELAMLGFIGLSLGNILLFTQNHRRMLYLFYDHLFVPFCVYWLVRLSISGEKELQRVLPVAFFTVVVQSAIGLLSWFAPQVLPDYWLKLGGARTVGTFGNAAVYTTTLIFFSLFLLQYSANCRSRGIRLVLQSVVGLAFFCVFFSFSRGSWLGGVVVIVGLMLLYPKIVIRMIIIVVIVAYVLSRSVLADQMAFAWERLTGEQGIRTAENRLIGNNASFEMIGARPLWGWGYRNYDRYDRQFQERVGDIAVVRDTTSHNTYLTLMAEMGVMAFFLYMFPLVWWLVLSVRARRRLPKEGIWSRRLLVMLWLLVLDHIIVSNFMDMVRYNQFGTTIGWMALGIIASMVHPYLKRGNTGVREEIW